MSKLVTKFRYYKPGASVSMGGYLKYIATREGVEKHVNSKQFAPPTIKQKELIEKMLAEYPDSRTMLEYEDYLAKPSRKTATEFLTRAIEDNIASLMNSKTYADYIATRPGTERFGTHGLFTDDEKEIVLSKVSGELNAHAGNVWTMIVSLRREDAVRLGFDNASAWRDIVRANTKELADAFKISLTKLRWYAAFHNSAHHPHIHVMVYSDTKDIGYLTKQGVSNMRAALAKSIFADDLQNVYAEQTVVRNELKLNVKEILVEIMRNANSDNFANSEIEEKLLYLAERLRKTKGKKVYGYLKPDVKAIIDSIVDILAKDDTINALYDLWYEKKFSALGMYASQMPPRIPLADNKEFKSIKNDIIREALLLNGEHIENENRNVNVKVAVSVTRLFKNLCSVFSNKLDDRNNKGKIYVSSDRRLRREEEAKKNAELIYD